MHHQAYDTHRTPLIFAWLQAVQGNLFDVAPGVKSYEPPGICMWAGYAVVTFDVASEVLTQCLSVCAGSARGPV